MKTINFVIVGAVCLALGAYIGISMKPNPFASIMIANASHKDVRTVDITVGMTTYVINTIEQSKSKMVNVIVMGEAGYKIKINFAGGDSLVNWNYLDIGNKIKETVTDSSIVSSFNKP